MTTEINSSLEKVLADRGADAVRMLLLQSKASNEGAWVMGLGDQTVGHPSRGDAERWLARKDAEKQLAQATRDLEILRWGKIGGRAAILAAVLTFIGVILTIASWRWPVH